MPEKNFIELERKNEFHRTLGLLEINVSSDLIQHVEIGLACFWLFTNTTVLPWFQNVFMNVLKHWKICSRAENVFWICSKLCYMFRDFVMNKDALNEFHGAWGIWLQWCRWQRLVCDIMMATVVICWWQNNYVGDFFHVKNRSPTFQYCHHCEPSPTSVINIDVAGQYRLIKAWIKSHGLV